MGQLGNIRKELNATAKELAGDEARVERNRAKLEALVVLAEHAEKLIER